MYSLRLILPLAAAVPALAQPGVQDSAGIRIVRNGNPAASPIAFVVDSVPRLRIGGENIDPRYEILSTRSAVGLADGGIAVAVMSPPEVRIFSREGRHVRTLGRKGQGPGEFGTYATLVVRGRGDTLFAWDQISRRVNIYSTSGAAGIALRAAAFPECCLPGGELLSWTLVRQPGADPAARRRMALLAIRTDSVNAAIDTIGYSIYGDPVVSQPVPAPMIPGGGGGRQMQSVVSFAPPFGRVTSVRPVANGFIVADGDEYEIRVHRADGRPTRIIRAAAERVPITAAMRRAYERQALRSLTGAMRSTRLAGLRSYDYPDRLPAFRDVRVDETGRIWVEEYPLPDAPRVMWAVYSAEGVLLGRAAVPGGHNVTWIGARELVTTSYDSDNRVSHVHVFPYTPAR